MHKEESLMTDFVKVYYGYILRYRYYFLLSFFLSITLGFLYIRYKLPVFNIKSTVLVDVDGHYSGTTEDFLEELQMFQTKKNINNEIGILKSYSLVERTLKKLDFGVSYYAEGKIRNVEVYKESPITVVPDTSFKNPVDVPFNIDFLTDSTFKLTASCTEVNKDKFNQVFSYSGEHQFGKLCETEFFKFTVYKSGKIGNAKKDNKDYFIINNPKEVRNKYYSNLDIEPAFKNSSILQLIVSGPVVEKEIDFLNGLCDEYVYSKLEAKIVTATNTLNFIDGQLLGISDSLNNAESRLENFRKTENVMSLTDEASSIFRQLEALEEQRAALTVKDKYYHYSKDYLVNDNDVNKLAAPSAMGVDDKLLVSLIDELVRLNSEKNALGFTAPEKNPTYHLLDIKSKNVKKTLIENLTNIINASAIALKDNQARVDKIMAQIDKLPKKERDLVSIQRGFNLNDHIYNFLMEKRTEIAISKAAITADNMILDRAMIDLDNPGKPNKLFVYLFCGILGLLFPSIIMYVMIYFDDTVKSKEEIERFTNIPFLGYVGHNFGKSILPLIETPRAFVAESFRSIRINLQYIAAGKKNKVIGITSSISGEGKTFFSLNLASSISLSGSKVVLVGADLRKPKLGRELGFDGKLGLSSYLINQATVEEIIHKTSVENLDIIVSGYIPPNPTELLESEKVDELISSLKKKYDYIIIDTPPIGLVADYFILSKYVDANLFIVRSGYTKFNLLSELNDVYRSGKMENIFVVLNDVKYKSGGYYGSYGYGYGYGYGSYFEKDTASLYNKIKTFLTKSKKNNPS